MTIHEQRRDWHHAGIHTQCRAARDRHGDGTHRACLKAGKIDRFHDHDFEGPLPCDCEDFG